MSVTDKGIGGPALVDQFLGTSYETVKRVADALPELLKIAEELTLAQGIQGEPGYTPQKGIDYFDGLRGNFHAYCYRNSATAPSTPGGGTFNGTSILAPFGWSAVPVTPEDGEYTYVSSTYFISNATGDAWVNSGWSVPAKLSGPRGHVPIKGEDYFDGVSGAYHTFIYLEAASVPSTPIGGLYDGVNEVIPTGWLDNIPNVHSDPVWMAKKVYFPNESNQGNWLSSEWSVPIKISGVDGVTPIKGIDYTDGTDGSYLSYVFRNGIDLGVADRPVGGAYDGTLETVPANWSDDPTLPNPGEFTYISKQRYVKVGDNYVGQGWSNPTRFTGESGNTPVKGVDYNDGQGNFTSYVFQNSVLPPALAPTGGTYDGTTEVVPDGWTDDPESLNPGEYTWMSKIIYREQLDGSWVQLGFWSTPKRFSGLSGNDGTSLFNLQPISNMVLQGNELTSLTNTEYAAMAVGVEYYDETWSFKTTIFGTGKSSFGARPDVGGGTAFGSLTYEMVIETDRTLKILENGALVLTHGLVTDTDVLEIRKEASQVTYRVNGATIHGSVVVPNGAYAFGGRLSKVDDKFRNISLGVLGSEGQRGTRRFYTTTAQTSWNTSASTEAGNFVIAQAGQLVPWDIVTLNNTTTEFTETRYWSGSVWVKISEIIDGNLLVTGSINSEAIKAGAINADHIEAGTITADLLEGTYLNVGSVNGDIQSTNYVSNSAGWKLFQGGSAELNNVNVRGSFYANSGKFRAGGSLSYWSSLGERWIYPHTYVGPSSGDTGLYVSTTGAYGIFINHEGSLGDAIRTHSEKNDGGKFESYDAKRGGVRAVNKNGCQMIFGNNTGGTGNYTPNRIYEGTLFPEVIVGGLLATRNGLWYGRKTGSAFYWFDLVNRVNRVKNDLIAND